MTPRNLRRAVLAAACWALLWAVAVRADDPTAETRLTEDRRLVDAYDERVSILSNGLTVILKVHRAAPVVSVRMYCQTGSLYEQEYLGCGMSHLFEHLLHATTTTTRTEEESRLILDQIGGNTNAFTSYDVTCYYINTGREHLTTAVGLLGDWLTHPTWPQQSFEREWGVVQRELERDADNPARQLFQLTMETMYRVHPARFPIIGYKPVVQTLKKEDIVGYHARMYVPDRMQVCIVGDIDLDETLAVVAKEFPGFARRPVPNITLPAEPEMVSPRFASKRMKVEAALLNLAWPTIPLDPR
jgi:zinc protease